MRPPRGQGGLGRDFKRYRSNCFLTAEHSRRRKGCYTETETPPGALAASEAPFRGKGRRLGEGAAQGAGGERRQSGDRGGGIGGGVGPGFWPGAVAVGPAASAV